MERIMINGGLIPGKWYWVRSKGGMRLENGSVTEPGEFVASKVEGGNGWPKSIMGGMWCDPTNDQALNHYEIYGPIPTPDGGSEERRLRKLLFLQHSHDGSNACLYGDDGEMQCGTCRCDFVRDSAETLERKIHDHGMQELVRLGFAMPTPAAEAPRKHVRYECGCNNSGCMFCDGGLFKCTVCGGFEGTLTTECPGRPLTEEEEDRIYHKATLDFKGGEWVEAPNYPRAPRPKERT